MLRSAAQTEEWLRKLTQNSLTMTGLRDVATRSGHASVNLMDNGAVVKLIAQQICSGQLRVCSTSTFGRAGGGDPGQSAAATDSKPFPLGDLKKKQASSSSTDHPPDANTFSDNLDGQAQAAALTSAASQGQPFCPQ
ncbi:MAG TPA: hypothetical protein VFA65_20735 [Bryobacteraceae bacterium]|nr:hypothetical protein [Bryobacteraceae bacterium]